MSDVVTEQQEKIFSITFNRIDKHNAFDDNVLNALQNALDEAITHPEVRVILLKAQGKHFSAGADLAWMQRMAQYSEEENHADARVLARVMRTLYECPKPTIAAVQGAAYGGGAGLVAACDIAIAASTARFCFSEVKLGLIPAVISPYVVKALGERITQWLFMSAEIIDSEQAKQLQLVQYCVTEDNLHLFAYQVAHNITQHAPEAVRDCKTLVRHVTMQPIDDALMEKTATLIAKKRISREGQQGLQAFLKKEVPNWR